MTPIILPEINWLAVLPSGLLTLTAILVLFWDIWIQEEDRPNLVWLTVSGFVVTGAVSFALWGRADASGPLALDSYALFFNGIFCLAGTLTVLMSGSYLEITKIRQGEYYALLLFAAVGMVLMAAATDLITIFLGLETMSIAVYVLAGIWHQRLASNEAALKYFLLGAFASGFLLYGMALIYGATGSLQLAVIAEQVAAQGSSTLLLVGMGLLLVGFGFKIAAAPFHVWTPDVYEGSPTTITAFMAVGVKAAAFAAFAPRLFAYPRRGPYRVGGRGVGDCRADDDGRQPDGPGPDQYQAYAGVFECGSRRLCAGRHGGRQRPGRCGLDVLSGCLRLYEPGRVRGGACLESARRSK